MDAENPFKTPSAELVSPLSDTNRAPLYTLAGVGLATFIGSPLAGGYLIGRNLKALGRHSEVIRAWGIAIAIFVVCNALLFISPGGKSTVPLTIAQVVGMYFAAQYSFGPALVLQGEQGGPLYSNWRAAGIGLLYGLCLFALILVVILPLVLFELI